MNSAFLRKMDVIANVLSGWSVPGVALFVLSYLFRPILWYGVRKFVDRLLRMSLLEALTLTVIIIGTVTFVITSFWMYCDRLVVEQMLQQDYLNLREELRGLGPILGADELNVEKNRQNEILLSQSTMLRALRWVVEERVGRVSTPTGTFTSFMVSVLFGSLWSTLWTFCVFYLIWTTILNHTKGVRRRISDTLLTWRARKTNRMLHHTNDEKYPPFPQPAISRPIS